MRGVNRLAWLSAARSKISTPDVTHVIKSMGISIADSKVEGPVRACLLRKGESLGTRLRKLGICIFPSATLSYIIVKVPVYEPGAI